MQNTIHNAKYNAQQYVMQNTIAIKKSKKSRD